ncbi:MAG: hypothetical protein WAK17_11405 [Candidatus Nitrosopolaris sp.]
MKLTVVSNITLDYIRDKEGVVTESLGGPGCYCGLTARRFSFDVTLATNIKKDFLMYKRFLLNEGIMIKELHLNDHATVRLTMDDIREIETDCWLVSPVINEVPENVLRRIILHGGKRDFVMVDPHGYTKTVNSSGEIISVDKLSVDLSGVSAIKADKTVLTLLTGGLEGVSAMQYLQARAKIKFVISTQYRIIHLLYNGMHYWIQLKDIDSPDSTGVGDILCAAFCCAYIKENDPLWALSFGAGAVRAALETRKRGLGKIPSKSKIEQSASYYYNTISFKRL